MRTHQLVDHGGLRMVLPDLTAVDGNGIHYAPPEGTISLCYCGYCFLLWWETDEEPGGAYCPLHELKLRQRFLALTQRQPTKGAA